MSRASFQGVLAGALTVRCQRNVASSGAVRSGKGRLHCLVQDLSLIRHQWAACQLVGQVELEAPLLDQMHEVIRDSPGVHLAGVERHRAGKVEGAAEDNAVLYHLPARFGEGTVTPLLGREVYD